MSMTRAAKRRAPVREGAPTGTDRRKAETKLQAAIVEALERSGCYVIRHNAGGHRVKRGYLHLQEKGFPDLEVLAPRGVHLFAEVKLPGEEPTKEQEAVHAKLRALGHVVCVWCSAQEATSAVAARRAQAWRPGADVGGAMLPGGK
jgi:hypothetical protein